MSCGPPWRPRSAGSVGESGDAVLAQFAYTPEAWAALIHAPQDRAAASDALVRHLGGRLIGLYYTPGAEYDGFALFEAPDARKWLLTKLKPQKFGDKIEQTHKGDSAFPALWQSMSGGKPKGAA